MLIAYVFVHLGKLHTLRGNIHTHYLYTNMCISTVNKLGPRHSTEALSSGGDILVLLLGTMGMGVLLRNP